MPWYIWLIIALLALGLGIFLVLWLKSRSTAPTPEKTVPLAVHDAEVKLLKEQLLAEEALHKKQITLNQELQQNLDKIKKWYQDEKASIDASYKKKLDELLHLDDSALVDEWNKRFGSS